LFGITPISEKTNTDYTDETTKEKGITTESIENRIESHGNRTESKQLTIDN